MSMQWFDHHSATQGRHDDAAQFAAFRRWYEQHGPPVSGAEVLALAEQAKAESDMDMYYVLLDEASYR